MENRFNYRKKRLHSNYGQNSSQLYANSDAVTKEIAYWNEIEQASYKPLPTDFEADHALEKDSEEITMEWSAAETEQLLKQANRAIKRRLAICCSMH